MGGRMHPGWAPTPPEDLWRVTLSALQFSRNEKEHLTKRVETMKTDGTEPNVLRMTESILESVTERVEDLQRRFKQLDERSILT